jgi:hypothetical protein
MKRIYSLTILAISFLSTFAQFTNFCGTDEMAKQLYDSHPDLQQLMNDKTYFST